MEAKQGPDASIGGIAGDEPGDNRAVDPEPVGEIGAEPVCAFCGSAAVMRDAWAIWNPMTGLWDLGQVFDHAHCEACDGATGLIWRHCLPDALPDARAGQTGSQTGDTTDAIRRLNDALRRGESRDGIIVITDGVQAKGPDFVAEAMRAMAAFEVFTPDNDPHGEHDFGVLEIAGERLFFKIDYYDPGMSGLSADPADPAVTRRVLTLLLASEY